MDATRHVNPNMVVPVLAGITAGEAAAGSVNFERLTAELERLTAEMCPPGDRPFVVNGYLRAKALAYAQGYFGAVWACAS